jgi:SPP1 gp7 family putative phage head morphogenesis protein
MYGPVSCGTQRPVAQKARDAREIAQWRTLIAKRRSTVQAFNGAFGRVLMQARTETLRNLEIALGKSGSSSHVTGHTSQSVAKATATDLLFDLAKFSDAFLKAMEAQQRSALDTAGAQLFAEVGKDDPFKYPGAEVLNYLAARKKKLSDTPTQIHEEIKAALEEGLLAGETQNELASRVRSAFNGISSERARRIAMTETAAAYGAGRDEGMRQAGVQYKRWLTSGGDNVRSAHADANGQTVPVDEPFTVDGEALMYPGDDAGSAANVINCHCVSIAVASEEAS